MPTTCVIFVLFPWHDNIAFSSFCSQRSLLACSMVRWRSVCGLRLTFLILIMEPTPSTFPPRYMEDSTYIQDFLRLRPKGHMVYCAANADLLTVLSSCLKHYEHNQHWALRQLRDKPFYAWDYKQTENYDILQNRISHLLKKWTLLENLWNSWYHRLGIRRFRPCFQNNHHVINWQSCFPCSSIDGVL